MLKVTLQNLSADKAFRNKIQSRELKMQGMIRSYLCGLCLFQPSFMQRHTWDSTRACRNEQRLGRVVIHQASVYLHWGIQSKKRTHTHSLFVWLRSPPLRISSPATKLAAGNAFWREFRRAHQKGKQVCSCAQIPGFIPQSSGPEEQIVIWPCFMLSRIKPYRRRGEGIRVKLSGALQSHPPPFSHLFASTEVQILT